MCFDIKPDGGGGGAGSWSRLETAVLSLLIRLFTKLCNDAAGEWSERARADPCVTAWKGEAMGRYGGGWGGRRGFKGQVERGHRDDGTEDGTEAGKAGCR